MHYAVGTAKAANLQNFNKKELKLKVELLFLNGFKTSVKEVIKNLCK